MRDRPNRILEFLTAPAKPDGEACRSNRRRRSSARIELSWLESSGWRSTKGRLQDISRGGASVLTRDAVPATRRARLRFLEGEGSPWIEATVLGSEPESPAKQRIRLRFEDPCPGFMLHYAVAKEPGTESESEEPTGPSAWSPWKAMVSE